MKLLAKSSKSKTSRKCSKTMPKGPFAKDGTCTRRLTLKNLFLKKNLNLVKSPSKNSNMKKAELKGEKLVKLK